mmetsp:Transcript_9076/g.17789  ORF Transcript_9076/g.17789 Transcript_9076/m.17789 type:complete len:128 (+) Transcript_9076:1569-1952(+)
MPSSFVADDIAPPISCEALSQKEKRKRERAIGSVAFGASVERFLLPLYRVGFEIEISVEAQGVTQADGQRGAASHEGRSFTSMSPRPLHSYFSSNSFASPRRQMEETPNLVLCLVLLSLNQRNKTNG